MSLPMPTFTHALGRTARRSGVVGALALMATVALAGPAAAHAEVESDTAQALAENVTLGFVSEAESGSAGFTEMRVVLPAGIAPGDVTLVAAPKGWKFKATDDGYTVGGPKLAVGTDAEYKVKVRQLPDAKELAFKTVETYSDGEISRWIELPGGGVESEQPAPVLKLKAAAPGAEPIGPSPTPSAAASSAPAETSAETPDAAADTAADEDEGSSRGTVIGVAAVALLALGGGAWWLVRRRAAGADS
ncbi:YcnI family protein [Streptomyces cinnabarinus]|uniref:YcnI family protein n=1 Tax=Streptomyces cinnabarinus TaxID=67287 RepID=A0ABY7KLQ9_9ACTN|nr:DUF1775 domain-containing protein [Streptomyces cinnabarinus]WAZ24625.1 YcnI family protein [Streptomyces cinnabarinus]